MTTKSGLKIILNPQRTFYNLFYSCSFLYLDLDMAKHTRTYFTFNVIVDLLMLIHFTQKKDTEEMFTFQNYWCLCSRWEKKAREKTKDQKRKKDLKLKIGKIWLNPQRIRFDDSINSLPKKSNNARHQLNWLYFVKSIYIKNYNNFQQSLKSKQSLTVQQFHQFICSA